jgi:DtxR family Mn-dependent transcriptional regulator
MSKQAMGCSTKLSPAIEDYVKAIYLLGQHHAQVSTSLLADHLGFAPASITRMLLRLAKLDLVTYHPYHGVSLSDRGRRAALEMLRHHRLLELLLTKTLGYSWDEVHAEADVLEHAISETLEARIAAYLGHPTADPHGDPIPSADLTLPVVAWQPLASLPTGSRGDVARVLNQDAAHLRYLAELGLVIGAGVTVQDRAPLDGPLTIAVAGTLHAIDSRLAATILVGPPGDSETFA